MIWSYRAIKNPAARKKWLSFIATLFIVFFSYGIYRVLMGENWVRIALLLALFSLFIFLYALITLGKPRYYSIDDDFIIYKPFKTRLSDIDDYSVDENAMTIKLKKKGILGVRTLYFEKNEDLREAERILKKKLKR
uniref:Uncharacterized protein n=1 Tax=Archaeoglobus fulgidus TaxID=2234 RepID=A0A7J2TIC5_ARCFL